MPNDYAEDFDNHTYDVTIDMSDIDGDTMTDAGVPVRDLEPIGTALLTPGDPSPVGRTSNGDLAYPVRANETQMTLKRAEAAKLAQVWATAHNITQMPTYPLTKGSPDVMFGRLINEALPKHFYDESNHGELTRKADIAALLAGDFDTLKRFWV